MKRLKMAGKHTLLTGFCFATLALPGTAMAAAHMAGAWILNPAQSSISITSVKKGKVGEAHHFKSLSGQVGKGGDAKVVIELRSIETNIGIRNKRMGKLLFEVVNFPLATITAKIDIHPFAMKPVGTRTRHNFAFTVDMHGASKAMKAEVFVTRISDKSVAVSTIKPVMLKAADFGMIAGIDALRKVAKLPSIAVVVPTTFDLVFTRK